MRKVGFIISSIVLFGIIIALHSSIFASKLTGKTAVDAIEKTGRNVTKVVYSEEVKGGVVVFYKKSIENGGESIAADYVKKTLGGWEWSWGEGHTDALPEGFSSQYFPYTKGTPFPLLFGEIKDQQIKDIKVSEKDSPDVKEAKIVGEGTDRLWFTFLNKSEGPNSVITGLSGEGATLYFQNIDTASAETIPTLVSQPSAPIETNPLSVAPSSTSSTEAIWSRTEFKLTGNLPEGWRITFPAKNQGVIFKRDKKVGSIEVYGYEGDSSGSGLPNHSSIIRTEEIKSGLGNGKLYTLERSEPAASKDPRTWTEYYAIFPIKGEKLAYNVWFESDDPDGDLAAMRNMLQVLGVNGEV